MAEEKLNLYQKLAKIRKLAEVIQKNKKGFGYTYVSEDEILAKVTAGMEKYGVSLIPRMIHGTTTVTPTQYIKVTEKPDKTGAVIHTENTVSEFLITGQIEWQWVNDEDPSESITIPWMLVGQQTDASQTFGSAWTYASRYFLLKYFNVATSDDDPDAYKAKKAEASQEEEKVVVEAIVGQIDKLVKDNVTDENRAALTKALKDSKLIMSNGKVSANYQNITDVTVATNVLAVVKAAFNIKEEGAKESAKEE
jgi:hypothetical protein